MISNRLFRPTVPQFKPEPRRATIGKWVSLDGEAIDQVVVTYFRAPHTYTGEDVLEISAHGNPLSLSRIVDSVRAAGARLAVTGEFTMRAVAHGKMDLVQAEAVREFIDAQTQQQARVALRHMEGALSHRVGPWKDLLVDIIAQLEAGIDFAEDDVDIPGNDRIVHKLETITRELDSVSGTFAYGRIIVSGLRVAILGKPNVGKSSLFNWLLSANRAIVTEIPGTTRDVLTETLEFDGVPIRLADTAGIRETDDRVEKMGVMRSLEAASEADFALIVLDGSRTLDDEDRLVLSKGVAVPHLVVINKKDLPQILDPNLLDGVPRVLVSAKTCDGLDALREAIRTFLLDQRVDGADECIITNARQYEALMKGVSQIRTASEALVADIPHEMVLINLYDALAALDELTGEVVTEDILDRIFATFCIGK
jgi:tRNA modification GTPase